MAATSVSAGSFVDWLLANGSPADVALVDDRNALTYGQLRAQVERVGGAVQDRLDGRPAVVPILGENSVAAVVAYLGVFASGAVPAPLAPLPARDLAILFAEVGAELVFAAGDDRHRLGGLPVEVMDVDEALAVGRPLSPVAAEAAHRALLLYTSGSTARPRGVQISRQNLEFNTEQILQFAPVTPHDCGLAVLPLYYCYGLSVLHTHLRAGARVLFTDTAYPDELVARIEEVGVTGLPGVPSLFQMLVARRALHGRKLDRLRTVMVSGGRLDPRTIDAIRAALPAAELCVRYGVTEATAAASYLPTEMLPRKPGSIGRGLPDAPLAVVRDDGSGIEPGSGETGEIVIRGPHVTLGYVGEEATSDRSYRDGAFYTGDVATIDADGFISIVGRGKQFVKTGGHRVSPLEVEDVISELPQVDDVAVVGVPSPTRGEAMAALVVVRAGTELSPDRILAHCADHLPSYKVPVTCRLVSSLPRTPNGKMDRPAVARMLAGAKER